MAALCWAAVLAGHAQRHRVVFTQDGDLPYKWLRPADIASPQLAPAEANARIVFLHGQGYLEATIDTCATEGGTTTCHVNAGRPYRWARLSGAGIATEIASEARFREKLHAGRPVSPAQVGRLLEDLLQRCENNGHPFARAWLDSLRQDGDGLWATVRLDLGRPVLLDSVVVRGTARTSMRYLQAHIGIKPGDMYNEALVRSVERRIRELPFVSQQQAPYVQFSPERTKLFLFLGERKASSINGILGFQPDPATGRATVVGDLDLRLRNALRRGEAISLNWRKLQDLTQDLRTAFNLPFAFNTPFGIDASLRLFKRDTTFLEVNARGGLDYPLARGDKLGLFLNSKSSSRLGSNLVTQPGLADVKFLSYGLGVERERYDYRFNPRRGHALRVEGSTGRKRSNTATTGSREPPPEVSTVQYEVNGQGALHLPLRRRGTLRLACQGGSMVNNDLYRNELHRIGGLKSMRGVDEASIFASSYAIGTLEYRYVFEENSNLFLFVEQSWWEDASHAGPLSDEPLGFGVGTTFETKAGLFSLTWALARQFGTPMELRGAKVHFGFISLF